MPRILAYGTWPSPISAEAAAASSPRLDGARFVGGDVWWGESVAADGGRMTVHSERTGMLLPAPWNVSSRVHEYGGGAWTASDDGRLFFVERTDQCVWELAVSGGAPRRLTEPGTGRRHGGLDWQHGRLLAVRETHTGAPVPLREIIEIVPDAVPTVVVLAGGSDFVAHPALSPDGTRLAWIAWDHPDMPWDRTRLRVRRLDDDSPPLTVAGGATAPLQPLWLGDDELLYADDATDRWNLWRVAASGGAAQPVAPAGADTGGALWVLGTRWFRLLPDGRVVAVRTHGDDEIVVIDPAAGTTAALPIDAVANVSIEDVAGGRVLLTASGLQGPPAVWLIDVDRPGAARRVSGGAAGCGPEWVSLPRPVSFGGRHGAVHAFDHPPRHPELAGPHDERPPYLVLVHGGPTAHTTAAASAKISFFTSRGIGVLDVNYGGSTGYGRAYRERLRGRWGVVDVDDVADAATGLAAAGDADPERLVVEGGSAGGWTALGALVRTDVFAAGISRYGVCDARSLAADTHDFEARYLDTLIGPLPEAEALYLERSPLSHVDRIAVPVLLLQGADDAVVPAAQAEAIRDALAQRGIPHAYVRYEGEGHGFRRPETVADVLRRELAFLGAVCGFTPDDPPPPPPG